MVKRIVTEISEADFRKLGLIGYETRRKDYPDGTHRFVMAEVPLNEVLDRVIADAAESGDESCIAEMIVPVTIAVHEPPSEEDVAAMRKAYPAMSDSELADFARRSASYLDKFMNCYTGARTFQVGVGIPHLYSTRDYYESHEDYWRVAKSETAAIYRIRLSPETMSRFAVTKRTVESPWPYDELPDGVSPEGLLDARLCVREERPSADADWKERYRYGKFVYRCSETQVAVDSEGKAVR